LDIPSEVLDTPAVLGTQFLGNVPPATSFAEAIKYLVQIFVLLVIHIYIYRVRDKYLNAYKYIHICIYMCVYI
jgi:hypothetical protein